MTESKRVVSFQSPDSDPDFLRLTELSSGPSTNVPNNSLAWQNGNMAPNSSLALSASGGGDQRFPTAADQQKCLSEQLITIAIYAAIDDPSDGAQMLVAYESLSNVNGQVEFRHVLAALKLEDAQKYQGVHDEETSMTLESFTKFIVRMRGHP